MSDGSAPRDQHRLRKPHTLESRKDRGGVIRIICNVPRGHGIKGVRKVKRSSGTSDRLAAIAWAEAHLAEVMAVPQDLDPQRILLREYARDMWRPEHPYTLSLVGTARGIATLQLLQLFGDGLK